MMRIGLIDDEPLVLNLLDGFIRELGYDVTSAASGERFLAGAADRDQGFDLIVTDFTMQGICGTSLIRELRHRFPAASIVVISGCTDMLAPDDDRGVFAFLSKPVRLGELEALLASAAELRGARA